MKWRWPQALNRFTISEIRKPGLLTVFGWPGNFFQNCFDFSEGLLYIPFGKVPYVFKPVTQRDGHYYFQCGLHLCNAKRMPGIMDLIY